MTTLRSELNSFDRYVHESVPISLAARIYLDDTFVLLL